MVEQMRMDLTRMAPDAYRHLIQLEEVIAGHIDRKLLHLVKMRASQINGCAYCIGMHTDEALRDGEKPERLLMLDAWHESSMFDDRERSALRWTEEITRVSESHAGKDAFDALKPHFSDDEIAWLTLAAAMINTWNRIAISSRAQYDPAMFHRTEAKVTEPA